MYLLFVCLQDRTPTVHPVCMTTPQLYDNKYDSSLHDFPVLSKLVSASLALSEMFM